MKKLISLTLVLVMVLGLAACGASQPAQQAPAQQAPAAAPAEEAVELPELTITFGANDGTDTVPCASAEAMSQAIMDKTDGKITVEFKPSGQLGGYVEMTESMSLGGLQMAVLDPTLMTEYAPEYALCIQPFIVKDYEHFGKILELPEIAECEAKLAENNITVLGYLYCGFRSMCSTREIKNVADCEGLILRSPEADIYMNTLKTLGMAPTPMAMSEMYSAIKSGVIEGAEPAAAGIWSYSLHELCPYILKSNHMFSFNAVCVSTEFWNSLPAEYQTIIKDIVAEYAAQEHLDMEAREQQYFDDMEAYGCTINEWENYNELVELFTPSWGEAADKIGGDAATLLESIKACA